MGFTVTDTVPVPVMNQIPEAVILETIVIPVIILLVAQVYVTMITVINMVELTALFIFRLVNLPVEAHPLATVNKVEPITPMTIIVRRNIFVLSKLPNTILRKHRLQHCFSGVFPSWQTQN